MSYPETVPQSGSANLAFVSSYVTTSTLRSDNPTLVGAYDAICNQNMGYGWTVRQKRMGLGGAAIVLEML